MVGSMVIRLAMLLSELKWTLTFSSVVFPETVLLLLALFSLVGFPSLFFEFFLFTVAGGLESATAATSAGASSAASPLLPFF